MTEQRCYYRPNQPRAIVGRHDDDCDDGDCRGCMTCPEDHCAKCYKVHSASTCPGCLGKADDDLVAIVELEWALPAEALYGKQATAELPGGEATVALGPWSSGTAAYRWSDDSRDWPAVGDWHPLLTLERWGEIWRDWFGTPEPQGKPTVASAAAYLRRIMHLAAATQPREDEWPPELPDMLDEIGKVRARLEAVLHAGEQHDRSQVPCLRCGMRLEYAWMDSASKDHWRCPKCKRTYGFNEYAMARRAWLEASETEQFVPLGLAARAVDRSPWTVRNWSRNRTWDATAEEWRMLPGNVRAACALPSRLLLVWWPDVRDQHRERAERPRRATTRREQTEQAS